MIKYPENDKYDGPKSYDRDDVIIELIDMILHKISFDTNQINTGPIARRIGKKWRLRNCKKVRDYINEYLQDMNDNITSDFDVISFFGNGKKKSHLIYDILCPDVLKDYIQNETLNDIGYIASYETCQIQS